MPRPQTIQVDEAVNVRVSSSQLDRLTALATDKQVGLSVVIRWAITHYLDHLDKQPSTESD